MKNLFKDLELKDAEHHHYILTAVFAIFVVFPIAVPDILAEMIDNTLGKIVIIIIALNLFLLHPMVGALGLLAAYELIKRSSIPKTVKYSEHSFIPPVRKKKTNIQNQFPVTVEEEIISNQIPYVYNKTLIESTYKPIQDGLQGAAKL